jgi:hypothetical protein
LTARWPAAVLNIASKSLDTPLVFAVIVRLIILVIGVEVSAFERTVAALLPAIRIAV